MWDKSLDEKLLQLRERGLSFAELAPELGVSRSAAIGRFQRIQGRVFPSEVARDEVAAAARKALKAEIASEREVLARSIGAAIASGRPRNEVIADALTNGATYQVIGEGLGVTKQRVHQIIIAG